MKNSILITLLAGSAMMLAGTAAQAQPGRGHDGPGRHGGSGGGMEHGMMMLRVADANGDNSITRAELDALQGEMFDWMDRNGDGYLDEADQSPVHQRMRAMREANPEQADRPEREGRRADHRRGGERRGPDAERRGPDAEPGMQRADADGDNRVSRAEFLGVEHPGFARLDQDSDGVITPAELDASVEQRHDRRRWWRN
ncbi:hypothetical protein [uncultured Maricaulis sp.]|uniref:EF-hand domain-containing protein n=1 Tax=uncultured Maricaulis sp. TaxID=174710 RepID=UPI0030D9C28B|tara:strand:- start:27656 stop:28252 length:597 start_codon:yes stop_codon:yes gene_type:complete